jgi:hypothetical protein
MPDSYCIFVSRKGNSFGLRLRDDDTNDPGGINDPGDDNLTTAVGPGDTVTWVLDPRADSSSPQYQTGYFPIASIENITKADSTNPKYKDSIPLLTGNPTKVNGVWTGTVISPSKGKDKFENYTIFFTVPGDTTIYPDDPKLQMDS